MLCEEFYKVHGTFLNRGRLSKQKGRLSDLSSFINVVRYNEVVTKKTLLVTRNTMKGGCK